MHVIVVGAGIAGLASTWALARQGIRVTLIEQDTVPGNRAASNDHQRLLRPVYPDDEGYSRMVGHASSAWSQLWDDIGQSHYHSTGCLLLSARENDWSDRARRQLEKLDLDFDVLSASALAEQYPMLETAHLRQGVSVASGGVLMARRILLSIGEFCESRDVNVIPGTAVTKVDFENAAVTLEDSSTLSAQRVLVTVGAWAGGLAPDLKNLTRTIRQSSLYLDPPETFQEAWTNAPAIVDFGSQGAIYAAPPIDNARLKFGVESHGRPASADVSRMAEPGEAVRMLETISPSLTNARDYQIRDVRICCYSDTDDGKWVTQLGSRGIAIGGCNGHFFKMGAVVGRGLAAWATGSVTGSDIEAWLSGSLTHVTLPEKF